MSAYQLYLAVKCAAQDVRLTREEFLREHRHLLKVLRSPSHEDDKAEAEAQRREVYQELGERI